MLNIGLALLQEDLKLPAGKVVGYHLGHVLVHTANGCFLALGEL